MGKTKYSTPLLCQSKQLCFSLFYLFTSLSIAVYFSISTTKCIFRSSPFDPILSPLFSYPPSYGEHKHSIPTLRSACAFPVHFSDYWTVVKEIQESCKNSSDLGSGNLRYVQESADHDSFGGNFSFMKRVSYFDRHRNVDVEIPCGFLKKFSVSDSDRIAMEKCEGLVVVSAIFGDHDKIRQPKKLGSRTRELVCFFMFVDDITLEGLYIHKLIIKTSKEHNVGVWRLVRVETDNLYKNAAMNGVIPKYLVHRLFPNSIYSIWVDAKLQMAVDPLFLIHSLVVKKNVDMAISRHPYYVHTMEEAMATARWRKWRDVDSLKMQMESYCEKGLQPWSDRKLPYVSDVPDSALILRKHSSTSNAFSCLLFNELEAFNPRDQLAFAFVRDMTKPNIKINMFEVEVFEQVVLEFRHNLIKQDTHKTNLANFDPLKNTTSFDKCKTYLSKMWRESKNP
ncbi:probable hexosyltransferase MUCI70 [Impatiens glandulifera]|uniref:probable hexosyltransferase MUCI70 n=1 Tax=Impatiens glandulifera TaxID=253017 RepID=UPI001FB065F2|nr:probable hexosyltransferase MUCI70 [Impatiens glandulifera]